ncbi:MAG TPA: hypothetical protein VK797_27450 [Tepidisphaeraceae bacterium]|nr:hypothetical protein [Tepidisphaeraceae bacterium]
MSQNVSGPTPPNAAGLEGEVERLQRQLERLRGLQASSRRTVLVLLVIVLAEFAAFAYYTKKHVSDNFESTAVQRAINERIPQMTPLVRDRMMTVTEHVLPVYRDEAMKRFQKVGPEVAHDAMDRLQKLPEDNGNMLQERLKVALAAAVAKVQPDMNKTFPTLTNEKKTAILEEEFTARVQKQNDQIARHITSVYETQLKEMRDVLDKFDVPTDLSARERVTREREFLHALVDVMMDSDVSFAGVSPMPASGTPTTMPTAMASPMTATVQTPSQAAAH